MAVSKAATIGVFATLATLSYGMAPLLAFFIGGVLVTAVYRITLKRCFNFMNPMALTGAGTAVLAFQFSGDFLLALIAGLIVSVVVGLLCPV